MLSAILNSDKAIQMNIAITGALLSQQIFFNIN